MSKKDTQIIEAAQKMAFNQNTKEMGTFIHEVFGNNKTMREISDHYTKLGYDAIVDIEDSGFADYPVILLDPEKSVKLKNVG